MATTSTSTNTGTAPSQATTSAVATKVKEGTITSWLVESGAEVTAGTPVLSIETDKVEAEVVDEAIDIEMTLLLGDSPKSRHEAAHAAEATR